MMNKKLNLTLFLIILLSGCESESQKARIWRVEREILEEQRHQNELVEINNRIQQQAQLASLQAQEQRRTEASRAKNQRELAEVNRKWNNELKVALDEIEAQRQISLESERRKTLEIQGNFDLDRQAETNRFFEQIIAKISPYAAYISASIAAFVAFFLSIKPLANIWHHKIQANKETTLEKQKRDAQIQAIALLPPSQQRALIQCYLNNGTPPALDHKR